MADNPQTTTAAPSSETAQNVVPEVQPTPVPETQTQNPQTTTKRGLVDGGSSFLTFLKNMFFVTQVLKIVENLFKDCEILKVLKSLGEYLAEKPLFTLLLCALTVVTSLPLFIFILCTFLTTVISFFAFIMFEGTIITVISSTIAGIAFIFLGIVVGSSFVFSIFYMGLQKIGLVN